MRNRTEGACRSGSHDDQPHELIAAASAEHIWSTFEPSSTKRLLFGQSGLWVQSVPMTEIVRSAVTGNVCLGACGF